MEREELEKLLETHFSQIEEKLVSKYSDLINTTTGVVNQMGKNCEIAINAQNTEMRKLINNVNSALESISNGAGQVLEASSKQLTDGGIECLREMSKENLVKQKRDQESLILTSKQTIAENMKTTFDPLSQRINKENKVIKASIKSLEEYNKLLTTQIRQLERAQQLLNTDLLVPIANLRTELQNLKNRELASVKQEIVTLRSELARLKGK